MCKAVRIGEPTELELELINMLSPEERKAALVEAAKKKVKGLVEVNGAN